MERYDTAELKALLPFPAADVNKYTRGKLMLFAGSEAYPGAALLAALAGQRMGAGYTEVVTAPPVVSTIRAAQPSLVVRSWKDVYESDLTPATRTKPCAYVLGPGFDTEKESTATITYFLLGKAKAPVLVDGGALFPLAAVGGRSLCDQRFAEKQPTIITPHYGEALHLANTCGLATDDPARLAYELALSYEAITVLKGSETYISDGEEIFAISSGTPALAKAGTGDVLSGMIGALLAQGLEPLDAAVLGVSLHAKAGVLAAEELTSISVTPEDVIESLPVAIKEISL